ncbi:hypothetical protein ES319_D07G135500v1 [Gossypium barbadense]|uniref:Uncharacterized protein n=2 Tax=Gossypium TaxID=3633 RepID=A0A5J5QQF0_GOSBA|nr:hypothetical protein ES319_D07G135500v1 [Gossypium barbadense]TYH62771.1 hypothetical protein ES332_D07G142700v1 [Gossypium tomentosum]
MLKFQSYLHGCRTSCTFISTTNTSSNKHLTTSTFTKLSFYPVHRRSPNLKTPLRATFVSSLGTECCALLVQELPCIQTPRST